MSEAAEAYNRIHAILDDARKLSGLELDRYLDESRGPDAELRGSVLELLAAGSDEQAGDLFAEENAGSLHRQLAGMQEQTLASWLPEKVGAYTILRQIGQGGMGIVYEAEQESPRRKVAIKLLHPMHATPESLRRFRREARLLGRLQHPGIARIIEASTYDLGRGPQPFFAMELVDGLPLTDYAEANALVHWLRWHLVLGTRERTRPERAPSSPGSRGGGGFEARAGAPASAPGEHRRGESRIPPERGPGPSPAAGSLAANSNCYLELAALCR